MYGITNGQSVSPTVASRVTTLESAYAGMLYCRETDISFTSVTLASGELQDVLTDYNVSSLIDNGNLVACDCGWVSGSNVVCTAAYRRGGNLIRVRVGNFTSGAIAVNSCTVRLWYTKGTGSSGGLSVTEITPTHLSVSGVSIGRLQVLRQFNLVSVCLQVTLTGTLGSYTKIAEGMPIPYGGDNFLDTAVSSSADTLRNMVVSTRTDSGLYIRYGASGTYTVSYTYICE